MRLKLAAFAAVVAFGLVPAEAECRSCHDRGCYRSATCTRGCVCLKEPRQRRGRCVSLEAL